MWFKTKWCHLAASSHTIIVWATRLVAFSLGTPAYTPPSASASSVMYIWGSQRHIVKHIISQTMHQQPLCSYFTMHPPTQFSLCMSTVVWHDIVMYADSQLKALLQWGRSWCPCSARASPCPHLLMSADHPPSPCLLRWCFARESRQWRHAARSRECWALYGQPLHSKVDSARLKVEQHLLLCIWFHKQKPYKRSQHTFLSKGGQHNEFFFFFCLPFLILLAVFQLRSRVLTDRA